MIIHMASNELLNQVLAASQAGERVSLATELEAALSGGDLRWLHAAADQAEAADLPLYLVGGVVRDLLLGRPVKDFDVVVEGDAIALGQRLVRQLGGRLTSHRRFGTAVWHVENGDGADAELPAAIDLISARRERYAYPGALPEVSSGDIQQDLFRRDFSINTLALRLDGSYFGRLLDPLGGLADLAAGQLRVLHDRSFIDDPTRILRILRFAARLDFAIEVRTATWLRAALPGLAEISGERLRNELNVILAEDSRSKALAMAEELGVLTAAHPSLRFDAAMAASLERLPDEIGAVWALDAMARNDLAYLLWLRHLPTGDALAFAVQLRLPQRVSEGLVAWTGVTARLPWLLAAAPSEVVQALESAPDLALVALALESDDDGLRKLLDTFAGNWRHVRPSLNGHDLRRRGLEPGPRYGQILARLRAAWLDGQITSPDEERALLDQLVAADD
jgi:tRNA nucleotidyltransferase (CCA-adding enzyme)